MESKLKNGLLTVCAALNRFNVQYYDLIEDKERTAREKDLEDIRQLKKTRQ